jgi:hypothetical protein
MNEIPVYCELLLNSDNDGIIKELLAQSKNYNTFWGPEYIIKKEKSFLDNNADEIIDLMVKSRFILRPV